MTIYIATLGDLTNWYPVDYMIDDKKQVEKVYSTVFTYENASKIILVINDSTIYAKSLKSEPAVTCYEDKVPPPPYNSYSQIKSIVEEYVKCVMSNLENEAKKYNQIESVLPKLKIISLPTIGTFSREKNKNDKEKNNIATKFGVIVNKDGTTDSLSSYYSNLTETLLICSLYNELKDANEDVVLDITHGFNYLPTLTFYAIYRLISLLGLRLTVINFIPIGKRKDKKNYETKNRLISLLWLILTKRKDKKNYETKIYSRVDIVPITNKELKFDIDQIHEENIRNDLNRGIIRALKYNAPLALVDFCQLKKDTLDNHCSHNNNYYSQFIDAVSIFPISEQEYEIKIDKEKIKWIENNDEIWSDVIADYVCEKVNELVTEFRCNGRYYNIEILVKLAENIFSRFSSISENIIKNDYTKITQKYSEIKETNEKKDEELQKSDTRTTNSLDIERIKRNYIAHAGLLWDIREIKKTNEGKICIKYNYSFKEIFIAIYGEETVKLLLNKVNI